MRDAAKLMVKVPKVPDFDPNAELNCRTWNHFQKVLSRFSVVHYAEKLGGKMRILNLLREESG